MKTSPKLPLLALAMLLCAGTSSAAVDAHQALETAKKEGCTACHDVHVKIVGPAFADVAAKYKGQADALDKLKKKVKAGGSGNWGRIPMPPHPDTTDADLTLLVSWVLSQEKPKQ